MVQLWFKNITSLSQKKGKRQTHMNLEVIYMNSEKLKRLTAEELRSMMKAYNLAKKEHERVKAEASKFLHNSAR
jgi:uncharacterized protein YaeQ